MLRDYGPDGLFWGYGGSGIFLSAGLVVDVVGAEGWALCERMFIKMNTDVQVSTGGCFVNPFIVQPVARVGNHTPPYIYFVRVRLRSSCSLDRREAFFQKMTWRT